MTEEFFYRDDPARHRVQRALDALLASVALVATAPFVAAAIVAIVLEDRSNPFFVQRRVGRFGKLFALYKLRTMKPQACGDAVSPATSADARITRVGRVLRATSIDELPQLLNVIKGDMAIVGPRPEMPFIVRRYERWQQLRHLVLPGITGLWQVECRSRIPLAHPDATMIDLRYIANASLRTDGSILLKTVRAVFSRQGAF